MIFTADREGIARQIKLAAIGGGACRALDRMLSVWPQPPCTVAVDTDDRSLDASRAAARLPLGARLAKGFGAGGDPRIGKLAAEESVAEWRTLCTDTDWLMLLTTLGGGTGTGAAPLLARVAAACGARVMAVATLPFDFEGPERDRTARRGLSELHSACDAVVAVPNTPLTAAAGSGDTAAAAFQAADESLGLLLAAVGRMVMGRGLLTLDIASLQRLLNGREEPAAFGFASAAGKGRAAAALADLRACPLLAEGRGLDEAAAALVAIMGGAGLEFSEVENVFTELRAVMPAEAPLFTGVYIDPDFGDALHLTAITVGPARKQSDQELRRLDVSTPLSPAGRRHERVRLHLPAQEQLTFDPPQKGRFKDVDPTIVDGEDLDIPTFVRRKIRFEAAR